MAVGPGIPELAKQLDFDLAVLRAAVRSLKQRIEARIDAAEATGNTAEQERQESIRRHLVMILQDCLDIENTRIEDSDLMRKVLKGIEGINDRITKIIAANKAAAAVAKEVAALASAASNLKNAV